MIINTKKILRFIIALSVTFAIFFIIQALISQASELNKSKKAPNFIEFIRIKQDDSLQERKRTIPDKPPTPKRPAKKPENNPINRNTVNIKSKVFP